METGDRLARAEESVETVHSAGCCCGLDIFRFLSEGFLGPPGFRRTISRNYLKKNQNSLVS